MVTIKVKNKHFLKRSLVVSALGYCCVFLSINLNVGVSNNSFSRNLL